MAEYEKRLHVASLNQARRHMTDPQKVLLGRKIEPDEAEAARQRQLATLSQNVTSGAASRKLAQMTNVRRVLIRTFTE
jgi:hypothetical protein